MTQGTVRERQAAGPPERNRTRELGMERLYDGCGTPQRREADLFPGGAEFK